MPVKKISVVSATVLFVSAVLWAVFSTRSISKAAARAISETEHRDATHL